MIMSAANLTLTVALFIAWSICGVVNPDYATEYEGALVTYLPVEHGMSFQLSGFIFSSQESQHNGMILHEYGHYLQQQDMGFDTYAITVGVPSIVSSAISKIHHAITGEWGDYYLLPWEADANRRAKDTL